MNLAGIVANQATGAAIAKSLLRATPKEARGRRERVAAKEEARDARDAERRDRCTRWPRKKNCGWRWTASKLSEAIIGASVVETSEGAVLCRATHAAALCKGQLSVTDEKLLAKRKQARIAQLRAKDYSCVGGGDATFTITVTNSGATALTHVAVTAAPFL